MAAPDTFTNHVLVTLVGITDGDAVVNFTDANGDVLYTKQLTTEADEVYSIYFDSLENVAPGNYFIQYKDDTTERKIDVFKAGQLFSGDEWLKAYPVPFNGMLSIALKAQEDADAVIKLTDIHGRVIEAINITSQAGVTQQYYLNNLSGLSSGVYFVVYKSANLRKTIRVLKTNF